MRWFGSRLLVVVLSTVHGAVAQVPGAEAPADKPAAASEPAAAADPGAGAQGPPVVERPAPPPAPEAAPTPAPESAPAPEKTPEDALPSDAGRAEPIGRPAEVAPKSGETRAASAPWIRAHSPLTLEGRLGFLVRPERSTGFDDESHIGADLGLALYMELARAIAAGIEIERASLGRGSAMDGTNSVSTDYSVTSAMLGFRAYPKRTEMIDLFVGLQVGLGIQGVSGAGTRSEGPLLPPVAYKCGGSDSPAFQIGGGVGARFMISPRWGITGRVNGTGRRLTSDVVDGCAQGIGTATTVSASIGLGYDFDLDP